MLDFQKYKYCLEALWDHTTESHSTKAIVVVDLKICNPYDLSDFPNYTYLKICASRQWTYELQQWEYIHTFR